MSQSCQRIKLISINSVDGAIYVDLAEVASDAV